MIREAALSPAQRTSRHPPLGLVAIFALCGGIVLCLFRAGVASNSEAAWISLIVGTSSVAFVSRTSPLGLLRPANCLLFTIALFHLGLAPYLVLGATPPDFGATLNTIFLDSPYLASSLLISAAAMAAMAVGTAASSTLGASKSLGSGPSATALERRRIRVIGTVLLCIGTLYWLAVGLSLFGLTFFTVPYSDWLRATSASQLGLAYYAIALGFVLNVIGKRRLVSLANLPFAIFALAGMPLGLRNEVLVPALAAMSMHTVTGWRPRSRTIALTVVMGLMLVGAVRELREDGLSAGAPVPSPVFGLEAIAEMGYSVRAVALVAQWQDEGDTLLHGGTYWAPVERLLEHLIPNIEAVPVIEDDRASDTIVMRRVGPVGFSIVAEANRNLPLSGTLLLMAGIGFLLASLERRTSDLRSVLILGVILNALLLHVRNSFTPVPFQLAVGAIAILIAVPPRLRRT
jgi:hypothetical protein